MNKKFSSRLSLNGLLLILIISIQLTAQVGEKSYEPVKGKIMGIWPHNDRFKSVEKLKELKDKWGFNNILIPEIYDRETYEMVVKAGFDSSVIMYQIVTPSFHNEISTKKRMLREIHPVAYYYFDEPISREHGFTSALEIVKILSEYGYYPKAKLVFTELTIEKGMRLRRISDKLMYSGYGRQGLNGKDQIETWEEWKANLGNQFSMTWVGSHEDFDEYEELFAAAERLGLNGIWFYMLEPLGDGLEASVDNFVNFCEAAVRHGFLKVK